MSHDQSYLVYNEEIPENYLSVPRHQDIGRGGDGNGEATSINNSDRNLFEKSKRLPQYIAAITATLSAASAGTVLAWTAPIDEDLINEKYNDLKITQDQLGWIGSYVTLGAIFSCFPTGLMCNCIGRKMTLLILLFPFTLGWCLIIWANSIYMIYVGRFVLGIASGACCVAAPLYTCEIAEKEVRGALGSYFQLMVTVGILFAYVVGYYADPWHYTIVCAALPFLFFLTFLFQPETPYFSLSKGRPEKARSALSYLRGKRYNAGAEIDSIKSALESLSGSYSIRESLDKKSVIKAFVICLLLMFFQQMSGINAIVFYSLTIFEGTKLTPKVAIIVVALVQVLATVLSSLLVDKLGRRKLLITSAFVMGISTLVLGTFFTLKFYKVKLIEDYFGFIPVVSLCLFVSMYSIGLGPIPWMISSEIFTSELKSIASSIAGTTSWFLAFIVTKFYIPLENDLGKDAVFYIFTIFSFIGSLFVYFKVPETKGKTIEQIQQELER